MNDCLSWPNLHVLLKLPGVVNQNTTKVFILILVKLGFTGKRG